MPSNINMWGRPMFRCPLDSTACSWVTTNRFSKHFEASHLLAALPIPTAAITLHTHLAYPYRCHYTAHPPCLSLQLPLYSTSTLPIPTAAITLHTYLAYPYSCHYIPHPPCLSLLLPLHSTPTLPIPTGAITFHTHLVILFLCTSGSRYFL